MKRLIRAVRGAFALPREPEQTGAEPPPNGLDRHAGVLLAVIVLAALIVRVWKIGHGLPHIYTTDEGFEVKRALKLGAGQFDFGRTFKGGLYFILFLEYALYYIVLRITGSIQSSYEFLVGYFKDPTPFWMMGRITNAVIGTLTVIPLYALGRRMGGVRTGLLAALFLTFCARHVQLSRLIGVDVLMVALLALCFLYLHAADRTGSMRALALASLFAALATVTKFPAIVATLSIAIVAVGRFRESTDPVRSIARALALCAFVFAGACVLVNPQIVPAMFGGAKTLLHGSAPSFNASNEVFAARAPKIWLFYWESITWSLGLPLTIAGILGALQAILRRNLYHLGLVAFMVIFYVAICSPATDDFVYPRYSQPIQLVLFLFAALLVTGIVDRIPLARGRAIALATITAVLIAVPTVRTIRHDLKQGRTDTRTLALDWIETNVPEGTRIVIEGKDYGPGVGTAPLANRPENIKAILQRLQERDSRWRSGTGQASGSGDVSTNNGTRTARPSGTSGPQLGNDGDDVQYAADKDRFHRAAMEAREGLKSYDLALFGTETFPYRPLSEYLDEGAAYLIVNARDVEEFVQPLNAARFPIVAAFYAEVQSSRRLDLRVRFDGDKEGRPGPDLLIYQVVSESRPSSRDAAGPSRPGIGTDGPTTALALEP